MARPLILVTNDDSINPEFAPLIQIDERRLGRSCSCIPDSPQSAMGHAITINNTLKLEKVHLDKDLEQEYSCRNSRRLRKIAVNENSKKKTRFMRFRN